MVDPVVREAGTPMEAIQARIAVLSERLPPRRTLWGEEIRAESGLGRAYDFVSPIASRPEKMTPIDREIIRIGDGPERIQKRSNFSGVMVNMRHWPEVYDEYTRLAGNDYKHPAWGLGAKDYLNAVVSGNHPMSSVYQILPDSGRAKFISNTVADYRKMVQMKIMQDPKFKNFAAEVVRLQEIDRANRMPVLGEQQ
jgi:hypothetical protein